MQSVVDAHVEIHFYPGEHARSLLGILARSDQLILTDEELSTAGEQAWIQAAKSDWLDFEGDTIRKPTNESRWRWLARYEHGSSLLAW